MGATILWKIIRDEQEGRTMSDDLPKIGSRWRLRVWIEGRRDWNENRRIGKGRYAPNRMTKNVIEIVSVAQFENSKGEEEIYLVYVVRASAGRNRNGYNKYRLDNIGFISPERLDYCWREEVSE